MGERTWSLKHSKEMFTFLKRGEDTEVKNTVHLYFSLIPSTFTLELRVAPPKIQHNV